MGKIPIIVIADSDTEVIFPHNFEVLARMTPLDAIARNGEVTPNTELALVDDRGVDRVELVQCGILLRNAGRTVIVCDTTRLPVDLLTQLHAFSVDAKRAGKTVQTELLLMEEAIDAATEVPGVGKLN